MTSLSRNINFQGLDSLPLTLLVRMIWSLESDGSFLLKKCEGSKL